MQRSFVLGIVLVSAFFAAKLWLGVYTQREFGTRHLFLKHRAATTFYFHAPRGESDRMDLTVDENRAESLYAEFVESGGGFRRSVYLFF